MSYFHGSERTPRLFLMMCVLGIFPLPAEQFPVREGFNLLLYPVSVIGPYGSHTVLIPVTGTEQNAQRGQTLQANNSKISAQSVSKPLHAGNGALLPLDPGRGPATDSAPSPAPNPPESLVLQGQMSNFAPSNVPLQVYSFVQQAVIVIYMVPVGVDSPNMGVMEGTVPNPDPGHLQVPASTPAATTAARPDAQGQLGKTAGTERATQTGALGEKGL
ncbi:Cell division control protein 4 [Labeo rohita]|uniref:Cell division control protein 4 n=1 Tax=Labeo rohita TaxID=84645 RepID=A0ABQ8L1K8_LABRO|nr:Cell division control protein 4 [Labeo rohita]